MPRYRFLPHTADAKFQAFGRTLEEAFANAALALASLMWDWQKVSKRATQRIKVQGRDQKQLLLGFLEEVLYLFETQAFLLGSVEDLYIKKSGQGYSLQARLAGDEFSEAYSLAGDVKAITYNEMEIVQNDRVVVQVVADI